MTSDEQSLRAEIVESQKSQADLLKWKLVSVAGVASVALGVGPSGYRMNWFLCLIPLICLYVDLISLHFMIRIVTIGTYLRQVGSEYERLCFEVRERSAANPFVFEVFALHGSSLMFGLLVMAIGIFVGSPFSTAPVATGLAGVFFTVLSWILYGNRAREVGRIAEKGAWRGGGQQH